MRSALCAVPKNPDLSSTQMVSISYMKSNSIRQLRKKIETLLLGDDFNHHLAEIHCFPPRRVVNPLFSMFYHQSEIVKWRAVTAMGSVVAKLADQDLESSRIVMRRFIWNLNDESGGIGWGSPEAMGEITARHEILAREYHKILISYINPDGNYLEHEMLQRGVIWGIGRLAHARPQLCQEVPQYLPPYLSSTDDQLRGLSLWAAAPLKNKSLAPYFKKSTLDPSQVFIFENMNLKEKTVAELAQNAISELS